jgi:hypothetical protein
MEKYSEEGREEGILRHGDIKMGMRNKDKKKEITLC